MAVSLWSLAPNPDLEDKARPLLPNPTPSPPALFEGGWCHQRHFITASSTV